MKFIKRLMLSILIGAAVLAGGTFLFMQQKIFGKAPDGARLERIEKSPNYKDGSFQNIEPTDIMLKDASYIKMMQDFFFKPETTEPSVDIPSVKTDLHNIQSDKPVIIWFGHSSYLIKVKNINILIDPVFSGNASPVSFFGKAFPGTDVYGAGDMPDIDILLITHDHYDHLDYKTISELHPKVKRIITPLGVGSHLVHWGVSPGKITETDWWESQMLSGDIEIITAPARHFSGRSFTRNKTLWASFILKIYGYNIFIGGDSGYDNTFKTIGEKYGPFDIAMLETGQYGANWPYIHMTPEQTVTAAKDIRPKVLLPVHWGKFALAYHDWNEPVKRLMIKASEESVKVTTPMIGEPVIIDSSYPDKKWYEYSE